MNCTFEMHGGSYRMQLIAAGLSIVIGAGTGCAGRGPHPMSARVIGGYWSTDRDVIMQVRPGKSGAYEAAIFAAPGMVTSEFAAGTVVIGGILPTSDGGYRGMFAMPDGGRAVRVTMRLMGAETLEITSGDGRVGKRTMLWRRVRTPSGAPEPRLLTPPREFWQD